MASRPGVSAAARQEALLIPAPSAGLHVFVPMEDFSIYWRGCTLSYRARMRYSAEQAFKDALLATDRAIIWES